MKTENRWTWAGWVVAGVMAIGLGTSGFQASQERIALVDVNKVLNSSKIGAKAKEAFNNMAKVRRSLLEFVGNQRILTDDQASKLRQLTVKENPTDADKSALEKLKDDIKAAAKDYNELNQKANPTDADRAKVQTYTSLLQNSDKLIAAWSTDFEVELRAEDAKIQADLVDKARIATKEVSAKKGITVVFSSGVVIYSANDLTEEVTKALDAKN